MRKFFSTYWKPIAAVIVLVGVAVFLLYDGLSDRELFGVSFWLAFFKLVDIHHQQKKTNEMLTEWIEFLRESKKRRL